MPAGKSLAYEADVVKNYGKRETIHG